MPQEAQVLIMLKCIICLIPSGHRGRNAVPKTNRSFLVALWKALPLHLNHTVELSEVRHTSKFGLVP